MKAPSHTIFPVLHLSTENYFKEHIDMKRVREYTVKPCGGFAYVSNKSEHPNR